MPFCSIGIHSNNYSKFSKGHLSIAKPTTMAEKGLKVISTLDLECHHTPYETPTPSLSLLSLSVKFRKGCNGSPGLWELSLSMAQPRNTWQQNSKGELENAEAPHRTWGMSSERVGILLAKPSSLPRRTCAWISKENRIQLTFMTDLQNFWGYLHLPPFSLLAPHPFLDLVKCLFPELTPAWHCLGSPSLRTSLPPSHHVLIRT